MICFITTTCVVLIILALCLMGSSLHNHDHRD